MTDCPSVDVVVGFETFSIITDTSLRAERTQIPLRLAWALTVHRSQGMTLDFVVVDFGRGTWQHGQAYTALTRVRRSNHIQILNWSSNVMNQVKKGRIAAFRSQFFPSGNDREKRTRTSNGNAVFKRYRKK